jgi:hypothetical protein
VFQPSATVCDCGTLRRPRVDVAEVTLFQPAAGTADLLTAVREEYVVALRRASRDDWYEIMREFLATLDRLRDEAAP